MKSYSNTYIFIFSTAMVIVVAMLLSFVAEQLKPLQEKNVEMEKKLDILRSVDIGRDLSEVDDKEAFIEEQYDANIAESFVVSPSGKTKEGIEAFGVNLKLELAKPPDERNLPVFVYRKDDGSEIYITPLQGKGLWGPIWGYIALEEDFNTVYGALFQHAKETPGLGAEINTEWFQAQFEGKKLFNEAGEFTSIGVKKGGADPSNPHAVDAVSGGTITSVGLEEMLLDCLGNYENYFKQHQSN